MIITRVGTAIRQNRTVLLQMCIPVMALPRNAYEWRSLIESFALTLAITQKAPPIPNRITISPQKRHM